MFFQKFLKRVQWRGVFQRVGAATLKKRNGKADSQVVVRVMPSEQTRSRCVASDESGIFNVLHDIEAVQLRQEISGEFAYTSESK